MEKLKSFGYTDDFSICDIKPPCLKDDLSFQYKCLAFPHISVGTFLVCDHITLGKRIHITRHGQVVSDARNFALEWSGLVHNVWIYLNADGN